MFRHSATPGLLALLATVATVAVGCSATTYDPSLATPASSVAATTTTLPSGTAAELLPRLRGEAALLSAELLDDGDATAVAERIAALWDAVQDEVGANRPDLLASFEANVALAQKAARFSRAADADKASRNFDALVTAYLGS
ncbi:MAG: hypothetical protein U0Q03_10125 [Acidimicrobiales bacterium]